MHQSGANLRFLVLVFVSVLLINVDTHTRTLAPVRAVLGIAVWPLQELVMAPRRIGEWVSLRAMSEPELLDRVDTLADENLQLSAQLQQIDALDAENRRLRELLSASRRGLDRVMLAEIEDISFEPFTQSVLINRGLSSGIYEGQPVLDAHGVMGQVVRTAYLKSAVSLVTDPGQTVPVMVERNGLRALTTGSGSERLLEVPYLDRNTDIRRDDLLVTSGMGGRFPYGYPVARVLEVTVDVNEPFLKIAAEPVARLGYSREVLLVWPGDPPEPVTGPQLPPEGLDAAGQPPQDETGASQPADAAANPAGGNDAARQ